MMIRQVAYGLAFAQRAPKVLALTGVCIAVLAAGAVDLHGADPVDVGQWADPVCWPFGATHMAHLPPSGVSETGRVLMFPAQGAKRDVRRR